MTIPRQTPVFLAFATAAALLQGCAATRSGPAGPGVRLYAADMNGGAKTCKTEATAPEAGKLTEAAMTVGSDGGWCGIPVRNDGQPFDAGLLTARPAHGTVFVHRVGDATRIDYTPDFGFAGTDGFTVQLLPNEAAVRVSVTAVAR